MNENEIANFGIVSSCGCAPEAFILFAINEEHEKITLHLEGVGAKLLNGLSMIVNALKSQGCPTKEIISAILAGMIVTDEEVEEDDNC